MSGNFFHSQHCKRWLFTRKELRRCREADAGALKGEAEVERLQAFFAEVLFHIGKKLSLRYRVVASACVFFKRVYVRRSMCELDPRVVLPTVVFVAAKAEEVPVGAKRIGECARTLVMPGLPEGFFAHVELEHMLAMEVEVLDVLEFDLIVYHPYRDVVQYLADADSSECVQTAWNVVNDSYRTDVPLIFPPYLTAIAAVFMGAQFAKKDVSEWIEALNVDMAEVRSICERLLSFYDSKAAIPGAAKEQRSSSIGVAPLLDIICKPVAPSNNNSSNNNPRLHHQSPASSTSSSSAAPMEIDQSQRI